MQQLTTQMKHEYDRIRLNSSNDPGTAGDEAENVWAELLRGWIPPQCKIVTKGQLIDIHGNLSPQVDIIILKPSYPPFLYDKKKYLLDGVLAVFECKLTLRKSDIGKFIKNSVKIKTMKPSKSGTPYKELFSEPYYGLLSHSCCWENKEKIGDLLHEFDLLHISHPREMPDIVCVADSGVWLVAKDTDNSNWKPMFDDSPPCPETSYMHYSIEQEDDKSRENFSVLGYLISNLYMSLNLHEESFSEIGAYFFNMEFATASSGITREWTYDIFSDAVAKKIQSTDSFEDLEQSFEWNTSFQGM